MATGDFKRAFKIGTDGDLAIEGGRFVLIGGLEAVAQNVAQRLRLFQGEWPFDTSAGFPYYQRVFVKNPNLPAIRALVRQAILATPGIREVTELMLTLDARTRIATGTYSAITDLGLLAKQTITIS